MWFPANYVEEISPSAAEPDRTVRIKPLKRDAYSSTFFCIYLKRNEYTCSHHSEVIHVFIHKDTYVLSVFCQQEMTENSPLGDMLRGSLDVSACQISK